MRIPIRSLAAALVLSGAAAAIPAPPTAERPPAGFTGGFGEESCAACHIGSDVNAYGGRVTLAGLPAAYAPGGEYVLTVVLEAEETAAAGFQLSARHAAGERRGSSAGVLTAVDHRTATSDSAGISYAHQTADGSRPPSPDGATWSVLWRAPTSTDPVTLSLAANSGNGDNSPLGDLVYTDERTVEGNGR